MPILPLVDLLILVATLNLAVGFLLKMIAVSTRYNFQPFGLSPIEFVVIAAICFGFALTLVARTWLKLNESRLVAARREAAVAEARMRAAEFELVVSDDSNVEMAPMAVGQKTRRADGH